MPAKVCLSPSTVQVDAHCLRTSDENDEDDEYEEYDVNNIFPHSMNCLLILKAMLKGIFTIPLEISPSTTQVDSHWQLSNLSGFWENWCEWWSGRLSKRLSKRYSERHHSYILYLLWTNQGDILNYTWNESEAGLAFNADSSWNLIAFFTLGTCNLENRVVTLTWSDMNQLETSLNWNGTNVYDADHMPLCPVTKTRIASCVDPMMRYWGNL